MEQKSQPVLAIVGLGLLGASLGLALRNHSWRRTGYARNPEVRKWALEHDCVDAAPETPEEALAQADLTILCLPIPVICEFLEQYAGIFKKNSVVTDIGSDKAVIVAAGEKFLTPHGVRFVGSHPMAGTENNGCHAAFPELYNNAEVFVTVTAQSDPAAVDRVSSFWSNLGTRVRRIDPEAHDKLVAHTSHISHILALALTLTVLDCDDPEEEALRYSGCATGFRDTSRIASSSPTMWREIIANNQPAVLDAARGFEKIYRQLIQTIADGDFDAFEAQFARGKALRNAWMAYKKKSVADKSR